MFDIVLNSPAFVIYVEALSPERKDFFSNNIINAGFTDMQIFPGVNARDETELNNAMALFPGIKFDNAPSVGQRGCLLSHLKVLKHIVDNKILILQGAHRLLNSLLNWDYQNSHIIRLGYNLVGLYIIDVMIIDMQIRMNNGTLNKKFTWYCWNGTKNPCQFNQLNNMDQRNSGLVFQSNEFKSIVA